MIKPINGHLLIEPLKQDSFIASDRTTYQEIGVVIDFDGSEAAEGTALSVWVGPDIRKGDRVYFDSWMAAKYPAGEDGFYWLVRLEDVRAIDREPLPEQSVS